MKVEPALTDVQGSVLRSDGIHNGGNIAGIPVATCGNQRLASKTSGIPSPEDVHINTDSEETQALDPALKYMCVCLLMIYHCKEW